MKLNTLLFALLPSTPLHIYKGDKVLFNGSYGDFGFDIWKTKYKVIGIDPKLSKDNVVYLDIEVE